MEYCDTIDICVKTLKGFLQRCNDKERQLKDLMVEREGWVETQMTEWAAADIQTTYGLDVWDTDLYFMIDVMAILISSLKLEESGGNSTPLKR
jgi:hypothetical protein